MNEQQIDFTEPDKQGHDVLDVIARAGKFNRWMFNVIRPYIKGRTLEIGSGIGNISAFLPEAAGNIVLSDYNNVYCNILKEKFSGHPSIENIISINLIAPGFNQQYASLLNSFDTAIVLNVIEHIGDDDLAIANCKKLLKKDGHLIILVPAYQKLYNQFDKELGHFRRYNTASLKHLMAKHLTIIHHQYFNLAGTAGWFLSGSVLKKKTIPPGQMSLYDKLVPVFKIIDAVAFNKAGLSVIAVGRKISD